VVLCGAGGFVGVTLSSCGVCAGGPCLLLLAVLLAFALVCWRVLNPPFTEGGFIPLFPFLLSIVKGGCYGYG